MSTAMFSRVLGPVLVERHAKGELTGPDMPAGRNPRQEPGNRTIHRISRTHHGRTLLTLGHAAEHLANSRRFAIDGRDDGSEAEAIHLLLGLSRAVFDDLAGRNTVRRRAEQWLLQWMTEKVEKHSGRCRSVSDNERLQEKCVTC